MSHKLNLVVKLYLGINYKDGSEASRRCTEEQLKRQSLLKILTLLMTKLCTIKGHAALRAYIDYVLLYPNETRWNGNFRIVESYFQLESKLGQLCRDYPELGLAPYFATPVQHKDLIFLHKALKHFNDVSLHRQKHPCPSLSSFTYNL